MIQRLKRICWLLHLNRFMEKYMKFFKNNNNLFFNSNIQKFYHWSNNTNKNMMIWAFLKRAVVCKANIQLFLLTTFESQGLFNNYLCHCRSPKFYHFQKTIEYA